MPRAGIAAVVGVVAAAGIAAGWALRGAGGERAAADRSPVLAPHPDDAPLANALRRAREDCTESEGAYLKLGPFDPETNLHAERPGAYKLRRDPTRLEDEYRQDRARRLEMAERLVVALGAQIELTPDEAGALYRALMERGDTGRAAAYRKEAGLISNDEKHEILLQAEAAFGERLKAVLPREKVALYEWAEASEGRDGRDLGFGAVYGMGGDKERFDEPIPGGK